MPSTNTLLLCLVLVSTAILLGGSLGNLKLEVPSRKVYILNATGYVVLLIGIIMQLYFQLHRDIRPPSVNVD